MSAAAQWSLAELLAELSQRTPAPGAGSAIAWSAALAAGLLEMVARYGALDEVAARAAALRGELLEAGERELHAYEPVLAARTDEQRSEALSAACEAPLAIAAAAAEVAELAERAAAEGKQALTGDAVAGVVLAEAATSAARRLVEINLAGSPGDPRLAEVERLADRAARARAAAQA